MTTIQQNDLEQLSPQTVMLVQALFKAGFLKPGQVIMVKILHDDDCAIWTNGQCNCDADIEIKRHE